MDQIPGLADVGKYGVAGVIASVMGWVIWQLKGELTKVWEARVAESKAFGEIVQSNSTAMAALTAASEARNRASEAQAKSLELSALAQTQMAAEIQRLRDTQGSLQVEIKELREIQLRRGGGA